MTSGEHTKGHTELPGKIWAERVGVGADDIALLASSLPIRSTPYYRADSVAELVKALETAAARFNLMGGVGLVNGADPRAGYREAMDALTRFREAQAGGGA
jgi:hypothetical protein